MMRDIFGRPVGVRPARSPWDPVARPRGRAPSAPAPAWPFAPQRSQPAAPRPWPDPDARRWAPRSAHEEREAFLDARDELREQADEAAKQAEPAETEAAKQAQAGAQLAEAMAELEASRARMAREAAREREADKLRLAGEVLPVLDDLDRSIAAARSDEAVKPALVEGFALVRARLERVLEGYGLQRIPAVGERFDPTVHDAIGLVEVEDPASAGVVIDEIERGYRAGGRVVRPARVRVGASS